MRYDVLLTMAAVLTFGQAGAWAAGPELATIPQDMVTLHVAFRSKGAQGKKERTDWDGNLKVTGGRVRSIRLWQEDPRNSVDGASWTLTTRHQIPWNTTQRKRGHEAMPLQDGALVVELAGASEDTRLEFDTVQGKFGCKLAEVPLGGRKPFMRGLVRLSRMPNTATILSAPTEDDYPSTAVGSADGVYDELHVAYVAFTHGEGFEKRPAINEPPKDYGFLAKPTGGDQVLLLTLRDNKWSGPEAVTPPNQDVYRTATAVDGRGGVWVFWSANVDENWDIYARRREGSKWSKTMRVSEDAGPDTFVVATTDSDGRVWIAWQGFRNGTSDILAARQDGDKMGEAVVVADGEANLWTPAIAASGDGQVAVAWDGYEQGNYDVACRVWSGGSFGVTIPVAATDVAEMRPSLTYDKAGRLWIAFEEAGELWGKDTGPYDNVGNKLYQQRTVAVRIWAGSRLQKPAGDPAAAFQVGKRPGKLAVPRLTCDASGRVWLAIRSPRLGSRVSVGNAWFEHLAYHDGDKWVREIICPQTDNILDNRPALVGLPSGEVVMVGSTDGRFATGARLPQWFVRELAKKGEKVVQKKEVESKWPDPVNNELMMAVFGPLETAPAKLVLEPAPKMEKSAVSDEAKQEAAAIAKARGQRIEVGGKTLQMVRGEFHRHTEISSDGGGDGLLMDMWRYALDAAGMDWIGNGDHDNGGGREYSWWTIQKTTSLFQVPGAFSPMYCYERSCSYPDGHRNVVFAQRGVRPLARLNKGRGKILDNLPVDVDRPNTPDTLMLYEYLHAFDGVCASHTSGTDMGTDWRDNDPKVEPIVEIYQGCRQNYEMPGAPRSNTAQNSIGGWRPFGFVSLALKKGYRFGFQSSSDHGSTHISYCNVWVEEPTREAILESMKKRHLYGATDNIIADVRCGDHFMGDEFTTSERPRFSIHLIGTQPFEKVHIIKDGNYVHAVSPGTKEVEFTWPDFDVKPGKTSYYYVRGEQEDEELVWVSPMWIKYEP